jgi:hypothetical protein
MREALKADETKYSNDPAWAVYLTRVRKTLDLGMRVESLTDADLDNKANKWPLLGEYLGRLPDTPHKQMLRKLTLGFWKDYSSISHASYDGLVSLFPFIADDRALTTRARNCRRRQKDTLQCTLVVPPACSCACSRRSSISTDLAKQISTNDWEAFGMRS